MSETFTLTPRLLSSIGFAHVFLCFNTKLACPRVSGFTIARRWNFASATIQVEAAEPQFRSDNFVSILTDNDLVH